MFFQTHKSCTALLVGAALITGCNSSGDSDAKEGTVPPVKNVILMITDGASDGAWDISTYWTHGEKLNDVAPYVDIDTRLAMTTFPLNTSSNPTDCAEQETAEAGYEADKVWDDTIVDEVAGNYTRPFAGYSYINKNATDSAAACTALATGRKTYNSAISVDYCGQPLETIAQVARRSGRSSGIVTSVQFNHATPAVFGAQHTSRNDYAILGNKMLTGGMADLIMGAGHPEFDKNGIPHTTHNHRYLSENDWRMLKEGAMFAEGASLPWTLIESKEAFERLANNTADANTMEGPLFGLVQNDSTLQQNRSNCTTEQKQTAYGCPFLTNQPSLKTMTQGALNYLNQNENGFFLMVEGGAVDWAAHANDTARIIEEQVDFNNSVQAVADWVEKESSWEETLLIVTTDHGNSYVLGGSSDQNAYAPVENPGKHVMPTVKYYSGDHTNELVRVYLKGAGTELINKYVNGNDPQYADKYNNTGANGDYIDNTNVFDLMKELISQ
ncbi:alkaline phosphatase [Photobacterium gaetbulicola]|uniref:Putative alkaline phosphatase n=1 Tax=Photobacterium gaetbulicola Gung47 TaxID=658445 RepID=A0A0C5WK15_9GAMM|nr:alkaline phosphatase [Photobacterium gaetbulicola]AJR06567.1 putative alkaline phosphatase [Photobacterium gaetbulicola Gung47]PSU13897.1 alkaline phosphatase [Photobacterium gaetbulicola]